MVGNELTRNPQGNARPLSSVAEPLWTDLRPRVGSEVTASLFTHGLRTMSPSKHNVPSPYVFPVLTCLCVPRRVPMCPHPYICPQFLYVPSTYLSLCPQEGSDVSPSLYMSPVPINVTSTYLSLCSPEGSDVSPSLYMSPVPMLSLIHI